MTARNVIIATGSTPFVPPGIEIDGERLCSIGRLPDHITAYQEAEIFIVRIDDDECLHTIHVRVLFLMKGDCCRG